MIGWPSGEKFNDTTSKACWETKVFNLTKGCQESSTGSEHEHVRKTEANQISKVRRLTGLTLPPSLGIEPNTSCRVNGACNASMPNFAKSHCALRRVGQRQWAALHFSLVCHCFCETEVPLTIQLQAWDSVCKETENCDVDCKSLNKYDESNHIAHTSTYLSFRVGLAVNTLVSHWVFGHVFGDAGTTLETLNLALISPWRQQRAARSNFWALNNGPIVGRALSTQHQETSMRLWQNLHLPHKRKWYASRDSPCGEIGTILTEVWIVCHIALVDHPRLRHPRPWNSCTGHQELKDVLFGLFPLVFELQKRWRLYVTLRYINLHHICKRTTQEDHKQERHCHVC